MIKFIIEVLHIVVMSFGVGLFVGGIISGILFGRLDGFDYMVIGIVFMWLSLVILVLRRYGKYV